jgi:hypothetical protein
MSTRETPASTQTDLQIVKRPAKCILLEGMLVAQGLTMPISFTTSSLPKSVPGFLRRYEADTKLIAVHKNHSAQLILRRSWTLLQAKELGEVRFSELLRTLGLPKRSPSFRQHLLLAENAGRLLGYVDRLPGDMKTLCQLAELQEDVLHSFIVCRGPFRDKTLKEFLADKESKEADEVRADNGAASRPP